MRSRLAPRVMLAVAGTFGTACHHTTAQTRTASAERPEEDHCGWAPQRTAATPDSVAARFAQAFATLGLAGAGWSHKADTAWAEGGPTALSRPAGAGVYAARVVAYRHGDTTLVRPFVAVTPAGDVNIGRLSIPFCGDAIRAAQAGLLPGNTEVPDDSSPVWRRRALP